MNINKFTQKSQEAVSRAQNVAVEYGHQQIDTGHLLVALLDQENGLVPRLLAKMDIPSDSLKAHVESLLTKKPSVSGPGTE